MKLFKTLLIAALSIISLNTFSQEKAGKKDTAQHITFYTCPMHDTVAMKKPGNCPVCGMELQLSPKEQLKMQVTNFYSCPMHIEVKSDHPGSCSKCGMSLNLSAKEKMKVGVIYTCPMHSEVRGQKGSKCPNCGMKLTQAKKKSTPANK